MAGWIESSSVWARRNGKMCPTPKRRVKLCAGLFHRSHQARDKSDRTGVILKVTQQILSLEGGLTFDEIIQEPFIPKLSEQQAKEIHLDYLNAFVAKA